MAELFWDLFRTQETGNSSVAETAEEEVILLSGMLAQRCLSVFSMETENCQQAEGQIYKKWVGGETK